MLIRLLNHNPPLRRLANEGYRLTWNAGHIVVHDVPYVDTNRQVQRCTLVVKVEVDPGDSITMHDHTIFFMGVAPGSTPCEVDGTPLQFIGNTQAPQVLAAGLNSDRRFSAKPPGDKYTDIYAKVTTYVNILGGPASAIDAHASPLSHVPYVDDEAETPFHYFDTASTRAEIMAASQKLEGQVVAIVGLGGSGSYVLDLVAKTPVQEIRLFDDDLFHVHNAFRAPGAPSSEELLERKTKVDHLTGIYTRMKRKIQPNNVKLDANNVNLLAGATFVFLCIDKPTAKPPILAYLRQNNISFTDIGMGLNLQETSISGSLRVTTVDETKNDHMCVIATEGDPDGIYEAAIQVAELNALTASLAVIKWKKTLGFYIDHENEHNTTYSVKLNELFNEEQAHPP